MKLVSNNGPDGNVSGRHLPPMRPSRPWLFILTLLLLLGVHPPSARGGYPDHRELSARLQALQRAHSGLVELESLDKTLGGREIWLLKVGSGELETRPAIAVVGGTSGDHLLGAELALQFAEKLLARSSETAIRQLLDSVTFYVFPDMNPDARQQYHAPVRYERLGNANPSDYDRDGKVGEDPYNDLNGDGLITLMRVRDPLGQWMPHPEDERIMVRARPEQGQRGSYLLLSEGVDLDKDGLFNEDGDEGVIFNRNFSFNYPAFTAGAGENAVSEIETRAIADFLFAAKNVFAVVSFGPANNLSEPLRYNEREAAGRIPTGWMEPDVAVNQMVSMHYRRHVHGENDPDAREDRQSNSRSISAGKGIPGSPGDFFQWAYFHYGRYSFSTPGWWIPAPEEPRGANRAGSAEPPRPGTSIEGAARRPGGSSMQQAGSPWGDSPAASIEDIMAGVRQNGGSPATDPAAQLAFLRWAGDMGLEDVFVPWTRVDHPGFPGKEVEVGGIVPHLLKSPPHDMADEPAEKHLDFILALAENRPQVKIGNVRTEALGNNLFRITADIVNRGAIPTVSQMGQRVRWVQKTVVRTQAAGNQEVVSGKTVDIIDSIGGYEKVERSWLVRGKGSFEIRAGAENTGFDTHTVRL